MKRTEWLVITLWVLVVTWLVYITTGRPGLGIDDAQIFLTYAQNLARGDGLIYSPGVPPAEGYTSSLWMVICALMFWLHANEIGVLAVSLLLLVISQILAFGIIDRLLPDSRALKAKLIYAALITASPAYLSWTTITLMDTGIWSTLIVAMAFVLLLPPATTSGWVLAALPFALAPLARPEAMAVVPAMLLLMGIKLRGQGRSTAPVWWLLASTLTTTLALTIFRLEYFGYPLPNTYYAKVASSTWYNLKIGIPYVGRFVLGGNIALIAAIVCVPFGWRLLTRAFRASQMRSPLELTNGLDDACQVLAAIDLLLLVLPIPVGGDHFKLSRLHQPGWPLLCLLLTFSVARILSAPRFQHTGSVAAGTRRTWLAPAGVVCLAALLSLSSYKDSWLGFAEKGSPLAPEFSAGADGERIGAVLDGLFADVRRTARPTIGVVAAGGIARTYRGPIIDLMGLNNTYIAHFPGDRIGVKDHAAFEKAAFYNLAVDMLLSSPEYSWDDVGLKHIFYDPKFTAEWRFGVVYVKNQPARRYESFCSKKFVASLNGNRELGFYDTMVFNKAEDRWEKVQIAVGKSSNEGQFGTQVGRQPGDNLQAARDTLRLRDDKPGRQGA